MMLNNSGIKKCGFTAKKCTQHDCHFWQQYRGKCPQTGAEIDKWECSHVMNNVLIIEQNGILLSLTAAAESSRNVVAEVFQKPPYLDNGSSNESIEHNK